MTATTTDVRGAMTAAITLMAQERGDVRFVHHSMYYPVTDAAKAMAWYWDAYAPDLARRDEPFAYAGRLRAAGVAVTTVRYDGISHDFLMLNPLSQTHATRAAIAQAIATLRDVLRPV